MVIALLTKALDFCAVLCVFPCNSIHLVTETCTGVSHCRNKLAGSYTVFICSYSRLEILTKMFGTIYACFCPFVVCDFS
jgi:hypothetical protein